MRAYQFQPVCIRVCPHKFVNVSIRHPVRDHRKLCLSHCHSYQRKNVGVLEGFPRYYLLAEPLHDALLVLGYAKREYTRQLTPIIFRRSLFEYVLMTFTATSRPQYSPFQTSAYPPLYNASLVLS